ncbi:hypothetical protein RZS08_66470, partial [Arthrospira platensis SPKY1]|nr:hypothetical protein [Arthrospira platensis SPKY1]
GLEGGDDGVGGVPVRRADENDVRVRSQQRLQGRGPGDVGVACGEGVRSRIVAADDGNVVPLAQGPGAEAAHFTEPDDGGPYGRGEGHQWCRYFPRDMAM